VNRTFAILALAATAVVARPAAAQNTEWLNYSPSRTLFTAGYQISQPIGSFHDYLSSTSFRGVTFDWRNMLSKTFSAGIRFNWNRWNENIDLATASVGPGGTGTVTGPIFRYAEQFGIQAIGHYYFDTGRDSLFTPFLGIGLGGVWNNSYQQTIDLGNSQNGFYFITTPELGVLVNLAKGRSTVALNLSVLYNFTTASFRNVSNMQAITETLGLTFAY
jgi:hypothetical protein